MPLGHPSHVSTPDRRSIRRQETIDEILAVAVDLMTAEGPGALNLAEVARRVGVKPPSLYQYFPSKLAVYDEIFARGGRELNEYLVDAVKTATDPMQTLRLGITAFVRWSVEHPVHAQIMFWRPVPGFTPSPESYEVALQTRELGRAALHALVAAGRLRPEAATDHAHDLLTTLVAGVVSQQLSNEPQVGFVDGHFASLIDEVLDMFLHYFGVSADEQSKAGGARRRPRRG